MATKKLKLTRAEAFYIEAHYGKKETKVIASDLGISPRTVAAYLKQLAHAGFKRAEPEPEQGDERGSLEKAGFGVHDPVNQETGQRGNSIAVVMTAGAAEKGDEARTVSGREFREKRLKNNIHVIDPTKPVR